MPRSSRHKSHKQSKHSSRDDRKYSHSDSEGDVKMKVKNGKDEAVAVRVSRDSYSGEKRKPVSQSRDCNKDPSCHGNGDASEEHVLSRSRKDRVDKGGADRWSGGGDERTDGFVVDKDVKRGSLKRFDSEEGLKSKDSKSKPSRRREGGCEKEEVLNEKEDNKSCKVESKRKLEKDSSRYEVQSHKESKDKELGSEKDRKVQDVKRDTEKRGGVGEVKERQGSESVDFGGERQVKRVKNAESPLQDDSRNPELEKELEKRIGKTTGSCERDKYQDDIRESDERRLSSRDDNAKNGKYRDKRQKDVSGRDKYREDIDRDHRHRDGKQREDRDREKRHRDDKYRDDRASRDLPSDKYDSKHIRDENNSSESHHKKQRSQNYDREGSPLYDDRRSRYKEDMERRRFDEREGQSDLRSQSIKQQHYDAENKSSTGRLELGTDRGRSYSRHIDLDSGLSQNRRRGSPCSSSVVSKDLYRQSKHTEAKFRHSGSEERVWSNAVSSREVNAISGVPENVSVCRSMEKSLQKDDSYLGELSAEICLNSDACVSPMHHVEKSPSSSVDRRYLNSANVRRSVDIEHSGNRSGGFKDTRNYSGNEGKRGRDLLLQAHSGNELSHVDRDEFPPADRNHLPKNSKSFLLPPPPSRAGADSPSVFRSVEDDNRGKSINQDGRIGDSNPGRAWIGAPNWPSPVANGFIPFQHGPPVGFHPAIQPFPASSMFGIRHSRELNHTRVPYHIPDSDRFSCHTHPFGWQNPLDDSFPPLHAWDANNGVIGNDSPMYARMDWDHNRTMMTSQGWETSVDMWKHNGVALELPSVFQKEDFSVPVMPDQVACSERNESNLLPESSEINKSTGVANDASEASEDISEKTHSISKISRDDDARLLLFYLAKLDVSEDLTHPELYDQCASLMEPQQGKTIDEDASQPLYAEVDTGVRVKVSSNLRNVSLFATINDSVFQRAVTLYERQKEEMRAIYPSFSKAGEVLSDDAMPCQENGLLSSSTRQEKPVEAVPTSVMEVVENAVPGPKLVREEMPEPLHELEGPLAISEKMEPDPANSMVEPIPAIVVKMEVDPVLHQVTSGDAVEDQMSPRGNQSPSITEEQKKLVDTVCGSLLFSNVPSEACEAEMPVSIDSGLVNLSRIHQSQSTH